MAGPPERVAQVVPSPNQNNGSGRPAGQEIIYRKKAQTNEKQKMLWSHFELTDFSDSFFSWVSPFPRSFPTNGPQCPLLFRCHSASTTVGIQLHLSDFDPNLRMDSGPLNSGSTSNYLYIPDFSLTDSKPKRQHKLSEWKWPEPGRSVFRGYKFGKETVALSPQLPQPSPLACTKDHLRLRKVFLTGPRSLTMKTTTCKGKQPIQEKESRCKIDTNRSWWSWVPIANLDSLPESLSAWSKIKKLHWFQKLHQPFTKTNVSAFLRLRWRDCLNTNHLGPFEQQPHGHLVGDQLSGERKFGNGTGQLSWWISIKSLGNYFAWNMKNTLPQKANEKHSFDCKIEDFSYALVQWTRCHCSVSKMCFAGTFCDKVNWFMFRYLTEAPCPTM